MPLKDKLRELRTNRGLTQEAVANYLDISAQTVSKWERGLLSPDVSILPKIAVLYKTSIDAMFDMESCWTAEHEKEFTEKIHKLYAAGDTEGVYQAWITEIELRPEQFQHYIDVMLFVLRNKLLDDSHIRRMIQLTEYAESYCQNDDIRNEIHRIMLQICSYSKNPRIKEKSFEYYNKLPLLKHSREVYSEFVMNDEQYCEQLKENIVYTLDLAECAVRKLIHPDMSDDEKLFYYQKAAAIYENILDDKYGGFHDVPLACDYGEIAKLLSRLGRKEEASNYIGKVIVILQRHLSDNERLNVSPFVVNPNPENCTAAEVNCKKLLLSMASSPELSEWNREINEILKQYPAYFITRK